MMGLYRTGKVPFEVIHLHSRVVDAHGKKMSKSKGNVMNPIDMVDKYGADALRFALIFGAAPGSDIPVSEDKIRGMRNFANKLWNIARYMELNFEGQTVPFYNAKQGILPPEQKIISELNSLIKNVNKYLKKYRFSDAAQAIYEFAWHTFADVYLEENKERMKAKHTDVLMVFRHVFVNILKLLHPFMPFVTEEIWSKIPHEESTPLIISSWPK
jgi:valyl-tRNA synthetase